MVVQQKVETPLGRLKSVFAAQKASFAADVAASHALRLGRLKRLQAMIETHEAEIIAAIHADFGNRAIHETRLADIVPSLQAISHARRHLARWMRPRRAATDPMFWPGKSRIVPQPIGVVGIIAPWNYPLLLVIGPLAGAIAAGNRAIVKPSEFTPAFSAVLERIVQGAFAEDEIAVITGGPDVAQGLTDLPLDHLVFTGSTRVGRLVAERAAKNLTPVTLELGGKSPVILDATADLDIALKRIVRGKMFNAGQTCVAPDYMLVPSTMLDEVAERALECARIQYPQVANNGELTAIIHQEHFDRLEGLLKDARRAGATVLRHADAAPDQRHLPLSVVTGVTDDMAVMQEEIFGPILPILPYDTLDDALEFIRARPHPLALYWFGDHKGREARLMNTGLAGGITINDTLLHATQENLPFGGVGESGMGAYHGQSGFDTMSHLKPVFIQNRRTGTDLFIPPISDLAKKLMGYAKKWARR